VFQYMKHCENVELPVLKIAQIDQATIDRRRWAKCWKLGQTLPGLGERRRERRAVAGGPKQTHRIGRA